MNTETFSTRLGAQILMEWLGQHAPQVLRSARHFAEPTAFHAYFRTLTGTSKEHFDSHGHACLFYLEALKRNGWEGKVEPVKSLGALLREKLKAMDGYEITGTDPDAAMIARDGEPRIKHLVPTDAPLFAKTTAHPPLAGLTRVAWASHLMGAASLIR